MVLGLSFSSGVAGVFTSGFGADLISGFGVGLNVGLDSVFGADCPDETLRSRCTSRNRMSTCGKTPNPAGTSFTEIISGIRPRSAAYRFTSSTASLRNFPTGIKPVSPERDTMYSPSPIRITGVKVVQADRAKKAIKANLEAIAFVFILGGCFVAELG